MFMPIQFSITYLHFSSTMATTVLHSSLWYIMQFFPSRGSLFTFIPHALPLMANCSVFPLCYKVFFCVLFCLHSSFFYTQDFPFISALRCWIFSRACMRPVLATLTESRRITSGNEMFLARDYNVSGRLNMNQLFLRPISFPLICFNFWGDNKGHWLHKAKSTLSFFSFCTNLPCSCIAK